MSKPVKPTTDIDVPGVKLAASCIATLEPDKATTKHPEPQIAAELPPAKVAIGTCLGKMIACPTCGKPTLVTHARGARTVTQVISSKFWVLAKCTGFCGNCLRHTDEQVMLLPESMPAPVVKPLGAVVGHFVLCPVEIPNPDGSSRICGAKAQAAWNMEDAHTIVCPVCGKRPYLGTTPVELVDVTESHVARTLTAPPKVEVKKRNKHTVVKHQGPFPGGIEYYFVLTYADGTNERINFNRAGAEISAQ